MTKSPVHKQCRQCGEWFTLKPYARPTQKFCTVSCSAIWRTSQPKWRREQSRKMKVQTDPEVMRERAKALWRDPEVRARIIESNRKRANTPEHLAWMAAHNKKLWADPARHKRTAVQAKKNLAKRWADPEFRARSSAATVERNKRLWANPDYRERVARSIRVAKRGTLSQKRQSKAAKEVAQRPEEKARRSKLMQDRWADPAMADQMRKTASETAKDRWKNDPLYRAKKTAALARHARSPENRERLSKVAKQWWSDPEYRVRKKAWWESEGRAKLTELNKRRWSDPAYKARVAAKISASYDPERRARVAAEAAKRWTDPEYRARVSARIKAVRRGVSHDP